jgi:hypothetical protein
MRVVRRLGKCLFPLGLLLGLLVVGEAEAKVQLPIQPALEAALTLLDTASGSNLPEAASAVRAALGDLGGSSSISLTSVEKFILEPPGGLYVLYNRYKVKSALKLLQSAESQLNSQIAALPPGPQKSADMAALQNVKAAIKDVREFLRMPYLF